MFRALAWFCSFFNLRACLLRMIQSQVINLVIGVVPRPSRITHATRDRVGSCGAKLLNGFYEHQWQAGLQLPFRFALNSPARAEPGKRFCFFRERVRQQAIGSLLMSWTCKCLISNPVSDSNFLRHCSASEAVGSLTMREFV